MPKIFISYRRADSQYVTDSIYDHMIRHFGEEDVFLDVGSIPFGVDFRDYLRDQIAEHDVILVIIGTDWARIMQERAGQSNDFVRIEIENALAMNKLIIPVLVKNVEMPDFSKLPASIADLQWRNSAIVRRQPDLKNDCQRLADGIKQYLELQSKTSPSVTSQSSKPPMISIETLVDELLGDDEKSYFSARQTGRRLGEETQPNIRLTLKSILPEPFDLIDIPAGKVTLLNDWDDDENTYLKKNQPQTFDVPAYSIAKYPVTNAQFSKFIEAGGYDNEVWWTEAGWEQRQKQYWRQPRYWEDSKWSGADYPVVGISWYESLAFCQWLNNVIRQQKIRNSVITLPTEQQWQRAAQGDDNRTYPWGNDWQGDECNHSVGENKRRKTSRVAQYEESGKSYFDVVDMAGNVWEWCLTDYNKDSDNNLKYVLRGGSCFDDYIDSFRCLVRGRDYPYGRDGYAGFRFVLSHT